MFLLILEEAFNGKVKANFNTSHVSINRQQLRPSRAPLRISIHLMFLLIEEDQDLTDWFNKNFNTSHVSINQV